MMVDDPAKDSGILVPLLRSFWNDIFNFNELNDAIPGTRHEPRHRLAHKSV